jgi:hypothetical protein
MKKLINLLFVLLLLLGACKKDKKSDFVKDYSPTLTEAKDVVYAGDYYPFATGYNWYWSGSETTSGNMTVVYNGSKNSEPLNGTENVTGFMVVNGPITISLPSGSYAVLSTNETDNTTRYFQVSDTAVIIRAILMDGMTSPMEVKNPVFIRKPLIVGDKWQSQPSVDYNQFLSQSGMSGGNIDLTLNCLIFVLGKENITWKNATTNTLALQERAVITGKIDISESGAGGTLNINFTLDARLNLKENVGLVKQAMTLNGTMSGNISGGGENVSLSMNINLNSTVTLDNYDLTGTGLLKSHALKSTETPIQKQLSGNPLAAKQYNKVMLVLKKIQNSLIIKLFWFIVPKFVLIIESTNACSKYK